jgi:hypothetical protein
LTHLQISILLNFYLETAEVIFHFFNNSYCFNQ